MEAMVGLDGGIFPSFLSFLVPCCAYILSLFSSCLSMAGWLGCVTCLFISINLGFAAGRCMKMTADSYSRHQDRDLYRCGEVLYLQSRKTQVKGIKKG